MFLPAVASGVFAGTTGKLSGRVLDPAKKPLIGANVILVGAPYGAATDAEGRFSILNVPPGRYDVKASMLGYRTVLTQGVVISADHTTPLDLALAESPVELAQVVVTAKRPVIDVGQTSNVATVSREEIRNLPVQELQDVVNLQAGVVDGHVRGGRIGEVQYQVDGVSVNNSYDNKSTLRLDRSLLEEVQVISGTFDAEYGQAMSGVVNAVLRRGTEKFSWQAEAFTGGYLYSGDSRIQAFEARPAALQNYQLNLSGPLRLPKTLYLVSARRSTSEEWLRAQRIFNPTDRRDSVGYHPSGDSTSMPLGFNREWSGLGKISTRLLPGVELTYQTIFNLIDGRRGSFAFRFNPDGQSRQRTVSAVHGFDWSHTLNKTTYYKLYARQNYLDYRDLAYPDLYDPRYSVGSPESDQDVFNGAYTGGVSFTRFVQRTNNPVVGGSYTSQVSRDQLVKAGLDFQFPYLVFGNPGYLDFRQAGGTETLIRRDNQPPDFPGVQRYKPRMASGFAQDEIEMDDLRIRAGVRVEYFAARATVPGDLANPANSIAGAPTPDPRLASKKISVMPRVGVSYPLTTKASVFFAYGQFTQMPPLGDIFTNADYSKLERLAAGDASRFGVFGNPDIKPERTIQYQFGYKQALGDNLGVDFNVFYKDIRDLLGVEFLSTYNDAEYSRLTNADFGNVLGFTVTIDQRALGPVSATVDYTWQRAQGNSSDPRETATRVEAGESPRPRVVPLNWDQRHTLNVTVTAAKPDHHTASLIVRAASGQPYTPVIAAGFGGGLETNSGRKPAALLADLRGEMTTLLARRRVSVFGRIFNLFDTRFFNGFVFGSSGSPYYSVYPTVDIGQLLDPSRLYAPRRVEVGVTLQGGAP